MCACGEALRNCAGSFRITRSPAPRRAGTVPGSMRPEPVLCASARGLDQFHTTAGDRLVDVNHECHGEYRGSKIRDGNGNEYRDHHASKKDIACVRAAKVLGFAWRAETHRGKFEIHAAEQIRIGEEQDNRSEEHTSELQSRFD